MKLDEKEKIESLLLQVPKSREITSHRKDLWKAQTKEDY